MWTQESYQKALNFAGDAHKSQKLPGSEASYIVHIANVTMEVMTAIVNSQSIDADLAIQCSLLHDTIEDTDTDYEAVKKEFGKQVADGVLALSKNINLPKQEQMSDSLSRIVHQTNEIGIIKMADRISNLQKPPYYWDKSKINFYYIEAKLILNTLKGRNLYIENRLALKIKEYEKFL